MTLSSAYNTNNNDDMFRINIAVENGSAYASKIDKVYAGGNIVIGGHISVIAETSYGNGKFSLELPQKVDEIFLNSLESSPLIMDINNLQISDRTAKIVAIAFFAIKGEQNVGTIQKYSYDPASIHGLISEGYFEKIKELYDSGTYSMAYIYADKPVTIKGTAVLNIESPKLPVSYNYNLRLKTGWNKCAYKSVFKYDTGTWGFPILEDATVEITNGEPAGLKWYYVETDSKDENISLMQ